MAMRAPSEMIRSRKEDSRIRRGAAIIRGQIRQQLDDEDSYRQHAQSVREKVLAGGSLGKTATASGDEDQYHRHAELKWNNAVGGDSPSRNTGTTCSTVVSEADESDSFRRHSTRKNRSTQFDQFVGRKGTGRSAAAAARDEESAAYVARRRGEADSDLFCPVACTAGVSAANLSTQEKVQEWTGQSGIGRCTPPLALKDDAPITLIGRGKSLRSKMVTYLVQPFNDDEDDDDTYGSASDGYTGDRDADASENFSTSDNSYLPSSLQTRDEGKGSSTRPNVIEEYAFLAAEKRQSPPRTDRKTAGGSTVAVVTPTAASRSTSMNVPSPVSAKILKDPAFRHAQNAGFLWQSLVGQHIRFPSAWWDGARAPPMGSSDNAKWQFVSRYKCRNNKFLNNAVRVRNAAGQLLLHIVVQDLMTWKPVLDVAIGVFHPNARGIRRTQQADAKETGNRDIWLALRKRDDMVTAVDSLLMMGKSGRASDFTSPLGAGQQVTNLNVRATFGESPPVETVFVPESDLYQRLSGTAISTGAVPPPMALLQQYVFG
jgi:hypothetical protein